MATPSPGSPCCKAIREILKSKRQSPIDSDMTKRESILLGAGILCLAAGCFLSISWETILDSNVTKEFILSASSKTFEPWVKTRIPVYIKFYFWNWTNPRDVRQPGYKPIMQECGPYTFREEIEKVDIVWNRNGTVTYKRRRLWFFEEELSNGTIDDLISTINVVAKSAAFITRYSGTFTKLGLNVAMSSTQSLDVLKPVRELLFEGYQNTLIDTAKALPSLAGVAIPFDRFGWFYKRNGSTEFDGVYNIETGLNGMNRFGSINHWNYESYTPFFDGECGAVKGSGGEFFPPKRSKTDVIEMFSPDLCRQVCKIIARFVTFDYTKEEVQYGVKGYRYEMSKSMFDNGDNNTENSCFCGGECVPPGALNVSSCRLGAPAFVSYPHFYMADPSYREGVVGMKPDPERHEGHITLEPTYGIPLDVAARFQINILMQPYDGMSMFKGLTKTFFPIMWFEQVAHVPEGTVAIVKTLLILPWAGMVASFFLMGIGVTMICSVVIFKCFQKKREPPLSENHKEVTEPMLCNGNINGKLDAKNGTITDRWVSTKI